METETKNGALVGLVIIIIILIIGGIYVWQSNKKNLENKQKETQTEAVTNQDSVALDALEQDLETSTNTSIDMNSVQ